MKISGFCASAQLVEAGKMAGDADALRAACRVRWYDAKGKLIECQDPAHARDIRLPVHTQLHCQRCGREPFTPEEVEVEGGVRICASPWAATCGKREEALLASSSRLRATRAAKEYSRTTPREVGQSVLRKRPGLPGEEKSKAAKDLQRKARAAHPTALCEHCGEPTRGGRFAPGHDAKLKSELQKGGTIEDEFELSLRGWPSSDRSPDREATLQWWAEQEGLTSPESQATWMSERRQARTRRVDVQT